MLLTRFFWKSSGPNGAGFAEDIELAVADQPVFRIRHDHLVQGERHCAEIAKLRGVVLGISLEKIAVLRARKPVAVLIPFKFELRQPGRGLSVGEVGDGVVALDCQRYFRGCRRY